MNFNYLVFANPADSAETEEDFRLLLRSAPRLYEEDENLGDEAFIRCFEDPTYAY